MILSFRPTCSCKRSKLACITLGMPQIVAQKLKTGISVLSVLIVWTVLFFVTNCVSPSRHDAIVAKQLQTGISSPIIHGLVYDVANGELKRVPVRDMSVISLLRHFSASLSSSLGHAVKKVPMCHSLVISHVRLISTSLLSLLATQLSRLFCIVAM